MTEVIKASTSSTQSISACLVVYNEEGHIERCLASLAGVVDEIIVVHDGACQDRTLEIAARCGARTFIRPHNGEAEKHRPFSYEQSTGEWILQIDADESLSEGLRQELRRLVEEQDIDAYAFRWSFTDGEKILKGFENETKPALFRKSKLYFLGIAHETPQTYGRLVLRVDLALEHWPGYNNFTLDRLKRKHLPWIRLQAREIVFRFNAPTFNIPDPSANRLFAYYDALERHPFWFVIKRNIIYDIIKKCLRRNPYNVFVRNWIVTVFFYVCALYLAWRIEVVKGEVAPMSMMPHGYSSE